MNRFDELKDMIIENGQLEIEPYEITADTDLVENFAYNSIGLILLMIAIEDKWEVDLEKDTVDADSLTSVKYLLETIVNQLAERS